MAVLLVACQHGKAEVTTTTTPPTSVKNPLKLSQVSRWFYTTSHNPSKNTLEKIVQSNYDMVIIGANLDARKGADFNMADWISKMHLAEHPKLVVAYVNIGEVNDRDPHWQKGWKVGNPDWITGDDPDGWVGDHPVAFWRKKWRDLWLGPNGNVQKVVDAGFDGIYLDWIEAYSDKNVVKRSQLDGVDPDKEIIRFVRDIANVGRSRHPGFLVIAQNAPELVKYDAYVRIVDAISEEQTWFDGASDNNPPGDCPLPRTDKDVNTPAYEQRLPKECLRQYRQYTDSTLHVSTESYLTALREWQAKGKPVFTIDYAVRPENVAWIYKTSRSLGFVPFVSERALRIYIEPTP